MNTRLIRILLVEDDEDDVIITRDLFSEIHRQQFHLDWVNSFEAAKSALAENQHDILLVDYRLGPHSGLELLRYAQSISCTAPFILLTGLGDYEVDLEAMAAGAADYLVKGQITATLLERSVTHALQRKEAEQRLRRSEEQYRLLFENNPQPMWVTDSTTGAFLAVNEAAVRRYGYSREEFLRLRLEDLQARPEPLSDTLAARIEEEIRSRADLKSVSSHATRSGKTIYADVTVNAILFKGRRASLMLVNDLTERLELETQLRQAQKMESIGTLAAGIAHDFNNLLCIIAGYASWLHQESLEPEARRKSLDAIATAVQRGSGLVKQILTFARKTTVQTQAIAVNDTVRELARMLSETFPKTIAFTWELGSDLPPMMADPAQVHQALLNLCVNARDAMPNGGRILLQTELVEGDQLGSSCLDAAGKRFIRIKISDTGTGVDESVRSRLFEPFFTTKSRDGGTGLGLAVVYGIVKSHGGYIHVESKPGVGTTFYLFFPAAPAPAGSSGDRALAAIQFPGGTETILVVEDEGLMLEFLQVWLQGKGYTLLAARDGLEAVQIYAANRSKIDLVLLDMGLPKMGGWEALERMRKINPELKCIVCSGYLEGHLKKGLLETGPVTFVHKPYAPAELLQSIRRVLCSSS